MKTIRQKGITLIALIITVIVLSLLIGVTVVPLLGQKGMINDTKQMLGDANTIAGENQGKIDKIKDSIINDDFSEDLEDINGTAANIVKNNNKNDYIGKYVTNYKPSGVTDIKWRIFYIGQDPTNTGENNIYLIADHYIPRGDLPAKNNKTPNAGSDSSGTRTAYFTNVYTEYTGSNSITSSNPAYNWLNQWNEYLSNNNTSSTNQNIRSVAYMMDTEIWNKFAISSASKYVIGGPTLELFAKSYNDVYTTPEIVLEVKYSTDYPSSLGYNVKRG